MGIGRVVDGIARARDRWRDQRAWRQWIAAGRPHPIPQACKRVMINDTGRRFALRVLVETGTNFGQTVSSAIGTFDTIYSIELDEALWNHASRRFAGRADVRLRRGDSARELSGILAELREPALFWLDAHYSGDGTARGTGDSPIMQELASIAAHQVRAHAILIDDARLFVGRDGYPTLEACRGLIRQWWPAHGYDVSDDVIRVLPEHR